MTGRATRFALFAPLTIAVAACGGADTSEVRPTRSEPNLAQPSASPPSADRPSPGRASAETASPSTGPAAPPAPSGGLAARLRANPPELRADRLPDGTKIGRCLLKVDGKMLISGRCSYRMQADGAVHIDGPHQVFPGIDFPDPPAMAGMISTDYWANAYPNDDGSWTAYGNASDVRAVHGDRDWGPLRQEGACFVNARVRMCVWRS